MSDDRLEKPLQALILEDAENDILLLLRELRRGGFTVTYTRVDNAQDMHTALRDQAWDIILSDYSMGSFDALAALRIMQEHGLDLPFIIMSGTMSEDVGVAAMKAGATDFFAKGKFARLVPSIEHGLREAEERRKRKEAEAAVHRSAERLEMLYQQIRRHSEDLEQRVLERTAELQASEAKYRALIEFAPDPIVIVNEGRSILLANKQAEEAFSYLQQELLGQPIERLVPGLEDDLLLVDPSKTERQTEYHRGANREYTARPKHGSAFPVKIGLSPIQTGTETLIMAYIVDITADKQLETSLRAALAREQELSQLKTSFTSIVSHEFRTPLSVILSATDLLIHYSERLDTSRRLEKLQQITRQVRRLVKLLDDVLTITRAESSGFACKPTQLDLVALCEQMFEELQGGYRSNIRLEFTHEGPCHQVAADEFLVSHILQNLVSNAMKYSNEGGTVYIQLTCSPRTLILRIMDQGIGIPLRDQNRLFEAFQRAGNVGQIQGTGIGLTIVKRAVDAHGGTIVCESLEEQGTTFTVTLPITDRKSEGYLDGDDHSGDRR